MFLWGKEQRAKQRKDRTGQGKKQGEEIKSLQKKREESTDMVVISRWSLFGWKKSKQGQLAPVCVCVCVYVQKIQPVLDQTSPQLKPI